MSFNKQLANSRDSFEVKNVEKKNSSKKLYLKISLLNAESSFVSQNELKTRRVLDCFIDFLNENINFKRTTLF